MDKTEDPKFWFKVAPLWEDTDTISTIRNSLPSWESALAYAKDRWGIPMEDWSTNDNFDKIGRAHV